MKYFEAKIVYNKEKSDMVIGDLYDCDIVNLSFEEEGDMQIAKTYFEEEKYKSIEKFMKLIKDAPIQVLIKELSQEYLYDTYKQYYEETIPIDETIVVVPAWEKYIPKDREIVIKLDSGMGWGNGRHATTSSCAKMLKKYVRKGDAMIDVGSGTGILAILASKLGAQEVDAIEIDEHSIPSIHKNIQANEVENINVILGELKDARDKRVNLIVANVVGEVLVDLKPLFETKLKEHGILILSGISDGKLKWVKEAYKEVEMLESIRKETWNTIVYRI